MSKLRQVGAVAQRPVTIRDIAQRAGVSTATVSRTLAHPDRVSEMVRKRVLEVVDATGYTPNSAARNLRARRSMMLLVVVPNIANLFYAEVLRGMDDEFISAGYDMIVGNLDNQVEREARYVRLAMAGQIDGVVIMSGRVPRDEERSMADLGLPLSVVAAPIAGLEAPQVCVNDVAAGREVALHLLNLGHRDFGFAGGPTHNVNQADRHEGFLEALAQAGVARRHVACWRGDYSLGAGSAIGHEFLALPCQMRPTAVFAASDTLAIGFMKVVSRAGVSVPGDVSVVGFDGIELGRYLQPTLTTVRQPRHELGRAGARALLDVIGGRASSGRVVTLPGTLYQGESSGPVPQHPADC